MSFDPGPIQTLGIIASTGVELVVPASTVDVLQYTDAPSANK